MIDDIASWTAQNAPAYYGPAFIAYAVLYKFTADVNPAIGRNLLRGVVFALLLGSKLTISADGSASVAPLWQTLFSGSAGFVLVGLAFWTVGGVGVSQLLDAVGEVLKQASKALRNSVVFAALLMLFGAIGAVATAPLGKIVDARLDANGAPVSATAPATTVPTAAPVATAPFAAPVSSPASIPAIAPIAAPATAATPSTAPAPTPATNP